MGVVAVVYNSTAFSISTVLYYSQQTFYSNYGSISCRFWDIQCRKNGDLEIGVRGHSRSSKVLSFDRPCMVSY